MDEERDSNPLSYATPDLGVPSSRPDAFAVGSVLIVGTIGSIVVARLAFAARFPISMSDDAGRWFAVIAVGVWWGLIAAALAIWRARR